MIEDETHPAPAGAPAHPHAPSLHAPSPATTPALAETPSATLPPLPSPAHPWSRPPDADVGAGRLHRAGERFLDREEAAALQPAAAPPAPARDGEPAAPAAPAAPPPESGCGSRPDSPTQGPRGRFTRGNQAARGRGAPLKPLLRTAQVEALMRTPYAYWVAGEYRPLPFAEAFLRRVAEFAMAGDGKCVDIVNRLMGDVEERRRADASARAETRRRRKR